MSDINTVVNLRIGDVAEGGVCHAGFRFHFDMTLPFVPSVGLEWSDTDGVAEDILVDSVCWNMREKTLDVWLRYVNESPPDSLSSKWFLELLKLLISTGWVLDDDDCCSCDKCRSLIKKAKGTRTKKKKNV